MITENPGTSFEARVESFPTGLTGTVGVQLLDLDDTVLIGRFTAGVTENPAGSGSYSTALTAPEGLGQYTIFWDTGVISPSTTASEELVVQGVAPASFSEDSLPTLEDVAAISRERTMANGTEQGTFNDDTRPTGEQVQLLIDKAAQRLENKIGGTLDPQLWEPAKDVIALDVAMRIELSFFATQVASQRSPYNELKALYADALKDLLVAVEAIGAQSGVEDPYAAGELPVFSFPPLGGSSVRAPGGEWPVCWPSRGW